jgi:hypothetical protein
MQSLNSVECNSTGGLVFRGYIKNLNDLGTARDVADDEENGQGTEWPEMIPHPTPTPE